jgi:hypothetical protein
MEHATSAKVSSHVLLQPLERMAKAVRVICSSLRSLVRKRRLRQLRDARQKHAGIQRLSTKSEMSCTQVDNSRREPRLTRIGACFNGPEGIVSDILFTWRTATLGARLHSLMAYSDWRRVSGCKPALSLAERNACDCSDELHLEGAPPATATRFNETVVFAKYVPSAYGSLAILASVRVGGSSLRPLVRKMMLRQCDPFRVGRVACCKRPFADKGEPWCSGKHIKDDSDATKTSKYAVSCLERQILDNPAMGVEYVGWFPAWSDLRAARWMKFSNDQALMPVQLADERRSAQMFAGCIVSVVAASLVLSVSLPLAAARSARLCRCLMAAALLRQAVSMPHGRRLFGAFCVVAFGRSQCGAVCPSLKAISEPMDIVDLRNHAFKCTCLGVPAKVGVAAEKRKFCGYHTISAGEVVPCYSRDEIADPPRALDGVIEMVSDYALFPYADRLGIFAASPEQVRQCRDLDVAADAYVASGGVTRKPQADEGDVATPHEVPEDEPVLDGARGFCDETRDLASCLCFRCRGKSASSAWKSEGATTMRRPEWSWHAVAFPLLEMHRRRERRIAGLIVNGSKAEWSKDSDSGRILLAECPALRRHQNLVKSLAMMMRIGMGRSE